MSGVGGWFDEVFTGADAAPTPQVNSSPPGKVEPKTWKAPDVSAQGQVEVHRDHLTTAADVIKQYVPEIDAAVSKVQQRTSSFSSLQGWQTGAQLMGNLVTAVQGFAQLGGQAGDAHATTSKKLSESAAAYEEAEKLSTQIAENAAGNSATSSTATSAGSGAAKASGWK